MYLRKEQKMFAILKSKYIRCLIGIFVFIFVSFVTYSSYASVCFLPTGDCGGEDVSVDTNEDLIVWPPEECIGTDCDEHCTGNNCNNSDDTGTKCTDSCTPETGHRTCTTDSNGCSIVAQECSGNTYLTQAYCTSANSGKTCTQSGSCWVVDNTNDEGNSPIDYCIETSGYYDTQAACTSANNGQNCSESNGCWIVDTSDSACEGYDVAKSTLVTLQDAYDVANFDDFVDNLQKYTLESCTVCPTDSTKYKCEYVGCPSGKTLYLNIDMTDNGVTSILSNTNITDYEEFVTSDDIVFYTGDHTTKFVAQTFTDTSRNLTATEINGCCNAINSSETVLGLCEDLTSLQGYDPCYLKNGGTLTRIGNSNAYTSSPYHEYKDTVKYCHVNTRCDIYSEIGYHLGEVYVEEFDGECYHPAKSYPCSTSDCSDRIEYCKRCIRSGQGFQGGGCYHDFSQKTISFREVGFALLPFDAGTKNVAVEISNCTSTSLADCNIDKEASKLTANALCLDSSLIEKYQVEMGNSNFIGSSNIGKILDHVKDKSNKPYGEENFLQYHVYVEPCDSKAGKYSAKTQCENETENRCFLDEDNCWVSGFNVVPGENTYVKGGYLYKLWYDNFEAPGGFNHKTDEVVNGLQYYYPKELTFKDFLLNLHKYTLEYCHTRNSTVTDDNKKYDDEELKKYNEFVCGLAQQNYAVFGNSSHKTIFTSKPITPDYKVAPGFKKEDDGTYSYFSLLHPKDPYPDWWDGEPGFTNDGGSNPRNNFQIRRGAIVNILRQGQEKLIPTHTEKELFVMPDYMSTNKGYYTGKISSFSDEEVGHKYYIHPDI